MEDLRNIIKVGTENGSRWYIISGRNKKTGKIHPGLGRKVKVIGEDYFCSCNLYKEPTDCTHVQNVKHFEEALGTKGADLIPEKEEKIRSLEEQIRKVESEKGSADEDVQMLKLQLKDEVAESQQILNILETQKSELEQTVDDERRRRFNAESIASGFTQTGSNEYNVPEDLIPYVNVLVTLTPKERAERLGSDVYKLIKRSDRDYKDKIELGTVEHHKPKHFLECIDRLAQIDTIHQINTYKQEPAKQSFIKGYFAPGQTMPNGQQADSWTIYMVYSNDNFGYRLFLKTMANNQVEAALIAAKVETKF